MTKVFKIEIRGAGFLPYEFESKAAAEEYAAACFWWGGKQYRIASQWVKTTVTA